MAYNNRGNSKASLDNISGAIADFTKAIEIDPENAFAYYNRAENKGILGDMDGACEDWRKASALGDEDAAEFVKEDCKRN